MANTPPPKIQSFADKEFHDLKVASIDFAVDYDMQTVKSFSIVPTGSAIADAVIVQLLFENTIFAFNSSGADIFYSLSKSRCFNTLNFYSINLIEPHCIHVDPGWNKLLSC